MAGRREWIGLAVLALPTLLLSLDMSVLYLALPQLSSELGADATEQLWITDIYGFMVAGLLITMGTLGDRIGRRKLLLIGAGAFSVASVLAAYSSSPEMLIASRAVLGIAGSTLMPSTLALIGTMFTDARQRGLAIAVWMSCFMGGISLGPVIGGALLEVFWWGAAFLIGVPIMVLLLIAGPLLLPEYKAPDPGRLDLTSVALSLATILPFIFGLKELAKHGWDALALTALIASVIFGVLFVRRQRRLTHPLLDLRLFKDRTFSSALTVWLLFGSIQGGSYLFFALYLQVVAGLSPIGAGLWLLPASLAMIVGSMLAPSLTRRFRPADIMATGLAIAAVGYLVLTQINADGDLTFLVTGMAVSLFGVGIAASLGTDLILGSVPAEKTGSASALSETSGELGIGLGIGTLGSLCTFLYRHNMPEDAPEAARESIASAAAAAADLPELLETAQESFTTALTILAGVSTVLFAALAVLSAVTLRLPAEAPEEKAPELV